MGISTHILDTTPGRPARGVAVSLEHRDVSTGAWTELARGVTDADGRVKPLLELLEATGVYCLHFEVAAYFESLGLAAFYPRVSIEFTVADASQHYHVPLLLNPFGYSTYRGS